MPEIVEIRIMKDKIQNIKGKTIKKINILNKKYNKLKNKITKIEKRKVENVGTKGKILWIEIGDINKMYIYIIFGLTGEISNKKDDYIKMEIELTNKTIYINDKLNFGNIYILDEKEFNEKIKKVGDDIMEITKENFIEKIKNKKGEIVDILVNQKLISGIGNWIRSEVLWLAKINPHNKKLTNLQLQDLYNAIQYVSWINYDKNKAKKKGIIEDTKIKLKKEEYYVYGRKRDILENEVKIEIIKGRRIYWVEKIQNYKDLNKSIK